MARKKKTPKPGLQDGLQKVGQFWHYHLKVFGHDRHGSTRCTDRESARVVLEEIRRKIISEHFRPGLKTTVADAVKAWLTYLKNQGRSKRHQALAIKAMNDIVLPALGVEKLGDLNQTHGDQVLATARAKKTEQGHLWADATIDQALIYWRAFLGWARKRDLTSCPISVELVSNGPTPTKVALTEPQLLEFIAAIDRCNDASLSLVVRAMAFLGLRVSEAIGMEWERWDSKKRIYTPNPATTKNRKLRPVPVPAELAELIEAQPKKGPFIAPGEDGLPMTRQRVYHIVRKVAAKMGVLKFSPHGLRRTLATILADSGLNPKILQEAMRHSNIAVTMAHYVNSSAEQVRPAIDSLSARVSATPEPPASNIQVFRQTGTSGEGKA
jgi:integrase